MKAPEFAAEPFWAHAASTIRHERYKETEIMAKEHNHNQHTQANQNSHQGAKQGQHNDESDHGHVHVHHEGEETCTDPTHNHHHDHAPQAPYIRTEAKVGRNETCPCGSGKKYKKCHGA